MSGGQQNKYYYFRDDFREGFEKVNQEFDPFKEGSLLEFGCSYIESILKEFESKNANQGLIFYVTSWNIDVLPTYGDNVIVFVMLDEFNREIKYRDKVGAVFRTCGIKPVLSPNLKYGTILEKFANILSYSRTVLRDGYDGRLRSFFLKLFGKKLAPVYDLPVGYFKNENVEYVPFEDRNKIMSFSGSIQHRVAKTKVPSPKELTRKRMVNCLTKLIENHPELPIYYEKTNNFKASIASKGTYTQDMMDSKFCLVPRGTTLETYRFYEAIKCGCIPIMEVVGSTPFYQGAPIIRLNNWEDLEDTMLDLLQKPDLLLEMHNKVLAWWQNVCSEPCIAKQIENHVNGVKVDYHASTSINTELTEGSISPGKLHSAVMP